MIIMDSKGAHSFFLGIINFMAEEYIKCEGEEKAGRKQEDDITLNKGNKGKPRFNKTIKICEEKNSEDGALNDDFRKWLPMEDLFEKVLHEEEKGRNYLMTEVLTGAGTRIHVLHPLNPDRSQSTCAQIVP